VNVQAHHTTRFTEGGATEEVGVPLRPRHHAAADGQALPRPAVGDPRFRR
jgi:hypothetical protein